jgi:hypothetical protein
MEEITILGLWHAGIYKRHMLRNRYRSESWKTKTSFVKLPYLMDTTVLVNILLETSEQCGLERKGRER